MRRLEKVQKKELTKEAINFFKQNSVVIEVVREDNLQTVFFPLLPYCKNLPDELNKDFRDKVDRTSTKTKLTALMEDSDYMIRVMKHEENLRRLFKKSKLLAIIAQHGSLWEDLSFYCACALNFIILVSYSQIFMDERTLPSRSDPNYRQVYEDILKRERLFDPRFFLQRQNTETEQVLITIGIVNLGLLGTVVFFFIIKRAPLLIEDVKLGGIFHMGH